MILKQRNIKDKEVLAKSLIQPGMYLYGYCGGRFGRDSYDDKLVLSVSNNQVTVRNENGRIENSFEIHSWVDLVEDSNMYLEQER
jgi:hypothetical protein